MDGYAKVAELMARYDELGIFRGFKSLNFQMLLYLQAEIIHLEEELAVRVQKDKACPARQAHAIDWWSLSHGEDDGARKQWGTVLEIQAKLENYSKINPKAVGTYLSTLPRYLSRHLSRVLVTGVLPITKAARFTTDNRLLKQVALAKLQGPNATDLKFIKSWFERPSMGAFPIRGLDMLAWDDDSDLVAIKPRATPDSLSKWLTNTVFPFLHRTLGQRMKVTDPQVFLS